MAQPIKKNNKFKDSLSKELTVLIDYMVTNFVNTYGVNKITPEIFVYMCLEYKDCVCYKVLNTFLSEDALETIHDELSNIVQYNTELVSGKFNILNDDNFKDILKQAEIEKDNTGAKLITSNHILLSILKILNNTELCQILNKHNISYDSIIDISVEVNKVTRSVYENKQKNIYKKTTTKKIDYCTNMMSEYENGNITETYGMDNEINQIFTVLSRKGNNNVILVGDKGVGKTQCVHGIVEKIYKETSPIEFQNKSIWKLNTIELYAGTSIRGSLEDRVVRLSKQLGDKNESILFIDDLQTILGQKHSSGEIDMSTLFNQIFCNKNIQVICCSSYQDLKVMKDNHRDIVNNFKEIEIKEKKDDECYNLLLNIKKNYEDYHKVKFDNDVIKTILNLSKTYITEKKLPLSAIEMLDDIGANKKINSSSNLLFITIKNEIIRLEKEKDKYINEDDIDNVNLLSEQIDNKRNILGNILSKRGQRKLKITQDDVYKVFSTQTGIPINKLSTSEKEKLKNLEQTFKNKIIGQDEAVIEICKSIKRNKVGLCKNNTPNLTTLAIGPSGVGKTLMAKILAKDILGDEKYLVRFDMSEYSDETSVNKLIGSSSGYVGYQDGGLLTEAIKRNKYCVLLFDEIEKSNQKVFNLFLQILDEGFLTDNMGQKVDFKNTYIIMTSNIGTRQAYSHSSIGFSNRENDNKIDIIKKEMKNTFPPEFLNRFDNILFFNSLSNENLKEIIKIELKYLKNKLNEIGHDIKISDNVIDFIYKEIENDKEYGARPIKRIIKNNIEDKIADILINNEYNKHTFKISITENKIVVE